MSFLGFDELKAQINCGTSPSQEYLDNLDLLMSSSSGGCSDNFALFDLTQPLTFNLILYVAGFGENQGEISQNDIISIETDIANVYHPHGIFFDIIWVDLDCDECLESLEQWPTQTRSPNCIQGYVLGSGTTNALNLGGQATVGEGTFWAYDYVIAHELGHALGLLHTHEEVGSPAGLTAELAERTITSGSCGCNCLEEGDKVCDTPPDPYYPSALEPEQIAHNLAMFSGCLMVNSGDVADGCGNVYSDPNQVVVNNVMSYHFCNGQAPTGLTAGQELMIRRSVDKGDGTFRFESSGSMIPFVTLDEVTSPQTLSGYNSFATTVTVSAHLLIEDATVEFIEGVGFEILPGGKLEIVNSKVGGYKGDACYIPNTGASFWQGITLRPNNTAETELIISENSMIEFSEDGIYNAMEGKGAVLIDGSTINNDIDIQFFDGGVYLIDATVNGSVHTKATSGLYIDGGSFTSGGQAILAEDTHLQIYDSSGEPCQINGANLGVDFVSSGFHLAEIVGAEFNNVANGIALSTATGVCRVKDCTINLSANDGVLDQVGIDVEGVLDFEVVNNTVAGTAQTRQIGIKTTGEGENANPNVLVENSCSELADGVLNQGDHGGTMGGLQYLCNEMDNISAVDFRSFSDDLGPLQGMQDAAAGNIFYNPGGTSTNQWKDFNYNASLELTYYFRDAPGEEPIDVNNNQPFDNPFTKQEAVGDPDCMFHGTTNPPSGGGPTGPSNDANVLTTLLTNPSIDQVITSLSGGGNPTQVIQMIDNVSPSLSISTAQLLLQYTEYFTEQQIVDALTDNTAVLYDEYICSIVFDSNSFSQSGLEQITSALAIGDTGLQDIHDLIETAHLDGFNIRDVLLSTDTESVTQIALDAIASKPQWTKTVQLIDLHISVGDIVTAQSLVGNLTSPYAYDPYSNGVVTALSDVYGVIIDTKNQNKSLSNISNAQMTILNSIANEYKGIATHKARNILQIYHGMTFTNPNTEPSYGPVTFKSMISPRSSRDVNTKPFDIYPNPIVDVLYVNDIAKDGVKYQIYSSNGLLMQEGSVVNGKIDLIFDLAGIYLINISTQESVYSRKIIKL